MSGAGQMDLFMVKQNEGSWGTPQNLGNEVNTSGNEVFPSMRSDGRLYFSSDGHTTLGGLDVMHATMNDGVWSTPQHVSYPLNSSFDDFSIVWNADNKSGYFTSDRSGADRIYTFTEINPTVSLDGLVTSKDGSSPLAGVKVTLMNLTDGTETVAFTGPDGKYNAELLPGKDYKVKIEKEGFFATTEDVSTKVILSDKIIQRTTELGEVYISEKTGGSDVNNKTGQGGESGDGSGNGSNKNGQDGESGDGSGNGSNKNGQGKYPIPNIYWDYNKWEVRPDAIPYLESVVKLFRDNQDLKFEIRSHCDCRGSEGFNEDLSAKRAKAVLDYLVKRGVPRSIIVSKGIGKKELLNGCDCSEGENCTESQHQENRRTEFIVTDKKKKK
jgi:outer membrane protein OmpA-like peptidoglycan-associated protein